MNIRFIAKTEKTVTLSRRDFDALIEQLEDARDAAAHRLALAAIKAGESELLPADMVKRMIAGESPVRLWREHRGMTARELAAKAAINTGYLSEIETGKKPGSVKSLSRIAAALGIKVDDLIP
jgi:ribosome-binding protein aMBF1 (putative translation factor)